MILLNLARRHIVTTMDDWRQRLEHFLSMNDYKAVVSAGTISQEEARPIVNMTSSRSFRTVLLSPILTGSTIMLVMSPVNLTLHCSHLT